MSNLNEEDIRTMGGQGGLTADDDDQDDQDVDADDADSDADDADADTVDPS
ncbi:MAG: hypothetical protein M3188_07885 [Actinomycetota bacterium]|nr:hypothetical protein [Actinomycetota bacterium]